MPTPVDYLTLAELKAALSITGETYADPEMTQAITAASRAVDEYCGRFFYKDSTDDTRKYTPDDFGLVVIDDLTATPTTVTDRGTALVLGTDYVLEPMNAPKEGKPYTHIHSTRPTSMLNSVGRFDPGMRESIVVTGKFGWLAVPGPVKSAATIFAARLTRRIREATFGLAGIGFDGAPTRILTIDPDLRMLLSGYSRSSGVA